MTDRFHVHVIAIILMMIIWVYVTEKQTISNSISVEYSTVHQSSLKNFVCVIIFCDFCFLVVMNLVASGNYRKDIFNCFVQYINNTCLKSYL